MSDDFDSFFETNYSVVERAVALAIGDRGRAEDHTQEAFARAYRRWRRVSEMENPVAWLYVVALNVERKRWRRDERASVAEDPAVSGVDPADAVITQVVIRDAIERLPPRQRAAIVLRFLADLNVAETARAMGCAEGTVKASVHQALKSLRVDVGGDHEPD